MRTWSKQLEELSSQVAQLKMDKQELQQRNRILESSLMHNTHHEERLHCNEVPALTTFSGGLRCTFHCHGYVADLGLVCTEHYTS